MRHEELAVLPEHVVDGLRHDERPEAQEVSRAVGGHCGGAGQQAQARVAAAAGAAAGRRRGTDVRKDTKRRASFMGAGTACRFIRLPRRARAPACHAEGAFDTPFCSSLAA